MTIRLLSRRVRGEGDIDDEVAFSCKDYRRHGRHRDHAPWARRVHSSLLCMGSPNGFHSIRHYGLLAKGDRNERLDLCRQRRSAGRTEGPRLRGPSAAKRDAAFPCLDCGGPMHLIGVVPPVRPRPFHCDTSRAPSLPPIQRHASSSRDMPIEQGGARRWLSRSSVCDVALAARVGCSPSRAPSPPRLCWPRKTP